MKLKVKVKVKVKVKQQQQKKKGNVFFRFKRSFEIQLVFCLLRTANAVNYTSKIFNSLMFEINHEN